MFLTDSKGGKNELIFQKPEILAQEFLLISCNETCTVKLSVRQEKWWQSYL